MACGEEDRKIKRGRLVTVRSPETIALLERWAGYLKDRFGKLYRQDIKRPNVLAYFRALQAEGRLETRDRVHSIGERVCDYADLEGDGSIRSVPARSSSLSTLDTAARRD